MSLGLPVRVQGHDASGTMWEEMTTTEDAYTGGVAFVLKHHVDVGHALHLSLPLPKNFRTYDLTTPSYSVYGLVRNTREVRGALRVGVMLLGKNPPRGYDRNPAGLFLLQSDLVVRRQAGAAPAAPRSIGTADGSTTGERRVASRFDVPMRVKITRVDVSGMGAGQEQTITRNVSLGGALVLTSLALAKGDTVLLEDIEGTLRTRAEVKNIFIGKDNIPRLNLRFLDTGASEAVRAVLRRNGITA